MLYKLTTARDDLSLLDKFCFDSDAPWGTEQDARVSEMIKQAVLIGGSAALWDDRVREPDEIDIDAYIADTKRQVWVFDGGRNIGAHCRQVLRDIKDDLDLNLRQEAEDIAQAIRIIYSNSVMTDAEKEHVIGYIREKCAK